MLVLRRFLTNIINDIRTLLVTVGESARRPALEDLSKKDAESMKRSLLASAVPQTIKGKNNNTTCWAIYKSGVRAITTLHFLSAKRAKMEGNAMDLRASKVGATTVPMECQDDKCEYLSNINHGFGISGPHNL